MNLIFIYSIKKRDAFCPILCELVSNKAKFKGISDCCAYVMMDMQFLYASEFPVNKYLTFNDRTIFSRIVFTFDFFDVLEERKRRRKLSRITDVYFYYMHFTAGTLKHLLK